MRPKHQQLLHLQEKKEVVVGAVCVDTKHGYAQLPVLAFVSENKK